MEITSESIANDEEESIQVELSDTVETEESTASTEQPVETAVLDKESTGQATFEGNANDLSALIALICGVIVFLVCASCGLGLYLLPVVAVVAGIIGLLLTKNAVNPQRAQLWSWLGLGLGITTVLLILIGMAVYILFILGTVKAWGY